MPLWPRLKSVVRRFIHRDRIEQDLDDELHAYVQQAVDEGIRRGLTAEEARRQALIQLGGKEQLKETMRDGRTMAWLDGLSSDFRYAVRVFAKRPAFTILAVLTMALGIGAATTTFSVVDFVLLRPLPYKDAGQLVALWETAPRFRNDPALGKGWDHLSLEPEQFNDLRKSSNIFQDITMFGHSGAFLARDDGTRRIQLGSAHVTLYDLLGVHPQMGRLTTIDDEKPDAPAVAVVSHTFWDQAMGKDPGAVGKTIRIQRNADSTLYTIVGVLPVTFDLADYSFEATDPAPDVWIPLRSDRDRTFHYQVIGRLMAGLPIADAERAIAPLLNLGIDPEEARMVGGYGARIVQRQAEQTAEVRPSLLLVLGATGLILLIACGNVANLLLGHAAAREHEMALRAAIGASRWRIGRQLVVESLLLSLSGGVLGTVITYWSVQGLVRMSAVEIPRTNEIGVDARVLVFAIALSTLVGIAFGLIPAIAVMRRDLSGTLQKASSNRGSRHTGMQYAVIVSEIALSFVLLVGAGLLTQSLVRRLALGACRE